MADARARRHVHVDACWSSWSPTCARRERNRPVALLQSQVGPVEGSFDLRQQIEGSAFQPGRDARCQEGRAWHRTGHAVRSGRAAQPAARARRQPRGPGRRARRGDEDHRRHRGSGRWPVRHGLPAGPVVPQARRRRDLHDARLHDPERAGERPRRQAPEDDPQAARRRDGPADDQRRGGSRVRRGARPGRQERPRTARRGDVPAAPGDPDRRLAGRRVPSPRRTHDRPGARGLRPVDDPGGPVRRLDRQRAPSAVQGAPAQAAPARRGARAEDPGEAAVPDDLHGAAGAVHHRAGPGAIQIYDQFFA